MRIVIALGGNGPQVGLLSLQAESYADAEPYPLDVLDAGTQGMTGYLIQQELRSLTAKTGNRAAIGSLGDITGIAAGIAGPNVITRKTPDVAGSRSRLAS